MELNLGWDCQDRLTNFTCLTLFLAPSSDLAVTLCFRDIQVSTPGLQGPVRHICAFTWDGREHTTADLSKKCDCVVCTSFKISPVLVKWSGGKWIPPFSMTFGFYMSSSGHLLKIPTPEPLPGPKNSSQMSCYFPLRSLSCHWDCMIRKDKVKDLRAGSSFS